MQTPPWGVAKHPIFNSVFLCFVKQLLGPVHIQICPDNLTSALKNGDKSYRLRTRKKLCTSYAAISTSSESY